MLTDTDDQVRVSKKKLQEAVEQFLRDISTGMVTLLEWGTWPRPARALDVKECKSARRRVAGLAVAHRVRGVQNNVSSVAYFADVTIGRAPTRRSPIERWTWCQRCASSSPTQTQVKVSELSCIALLIRLVLDPEDDENDDVPAADEPGDEAPAAEPGDEAPAANEPGDEAPAAEPGDEAPAADEPGDEAPAADEPGDEAPAADASGDEAPAAPKPARRASRRSYAQALCFDHFRRVPVNQGRNVDQASREPIRFDSGKVPFFISAEERERKSRRHFFVLLS